MTKPKLSIYSAVVLRGCIEDRIRAIKEAGFDAVCLDFEAELANTETAWENQMRLADKYGLPVENVHLTGAGMTDVWRDGANGDAVADRLCEELRRMASLGVRTGVAHVTWGHDAPGGDFARGLDRYLRCAETAEQYGVYLALENSVYPAYVHFLLDHIDSAHVGFCYDSGHENAFAPEEDFLSRHGNRLLAMHLHDNDGKQDLHAFPGDGTIDWTKKKAQLAQTALWHRMITLECGFSHDDVYAGFRAAYACAVRMFL